MKEIEGEPVRGERVLVRCDFNEGLDEEGRLVDNYKIERSLSTIGYLAEEGARLVLMSHLGRPGGEREEALSMEPVQEELVRLLDRSVALAPDCIGKEIERWTEEMREGEILLLENLRFRRGETENDGRFTRRLSRLGDVYVNEAFAASHREHASIVGVPNYLPSFIGPLFKEEADVLSRVLKEPSRPVVGIVGGAKVEEKSAAVSGLLSKVDHLLVGGLTGLRLKEEGATHDKLVLPVDSRKEAGKVVDIGPGTVELFKEKIEKAGTVFWAGPVGDTRHERFKEGSRSLAGAVLESGAFAVAGGGDTLDFLRDEGLDDRFDYLSTGGGAMLAYLSTGTLPGLESLKNR